MKIRIAKDIAIRWTIKTNGQSTALSGRDIVIILTDPYGGKTTLNFAVSNVNVASMTWYGKNQKYLGKYTLTALENAGEDASTALDSVDFVELVATTAEEDTSATTEGLDTETVDLSGDLQQNGRGLSAYEVAVAEGYSGTVTQWLASLHAPNLQSQYSEDGTSWHATPTDDDIYMRTSADGGTTWSSAIKIRGASSYSDLDDKPQIGGTTLEGNKTLAQLGIEPADDSIVKDANYVHTDNNYTSAEKEKVASAITEHQSLSAYRTSAAQDVIDNAEAAARTAADAAINDKIPSQATAENQLADKEFVNSSIATSTATFRGNVAAADDTEAAAQTALATISTKDNNDYANVVVQNTPAAGVDKYKRYTYNGSEWVFNYALNSSGFTAAQWSAINSGATAEQIAAIAEKYVKPSGGIPSTDLSSAVQTTLNEVSDKVNKPTSETYSISSWSDLSGATPFTKQATVTASHTISTDTIVELINNAPVAFANYGFQIGAVSGQTVTIYALEAPSAAVNITIHYTD